MTKAEREKQRSVTHDATGGRAGGQGGCACGGSNGRPVRIMIVGPICVRISSGVPIIEAGLPMPMPPPP